MPEILRARTAAVPIRGTQSFVNVMASVWKRPSLTAMEILWRWSVGLPNLALMLFELRLIASRTTLNTAALEAITVFQPLAAFQSIDAAMSALSPVALPVLRWLLPLIGVVWLLAAAFGRSMVLRRLDNSLKCRPVALLVLGTLRFAALSLAWMLWFGLLLEAGNFAISRPAGRGGEPNIVLYAAILICGSLLLYVAWAIVSWPLELAPLLAMQQGLGPGKALSNAIRINAVSGKLIEINLVMHIVKIAALVLAMVFSASPLPFTSVETQVYVNFWWGGVLLLYLAASDYFHVVRSAAYLSLWKFYEGSALPITAN